MTWDDNSEEQTGACTRGYDKGEHYTVLYTVRPPRIREQVDREAKMARIDEQ